MSILRFCRGSQDVYEPLSDGDVISRKLVIPRKERASPLPDVKGSGEAILILKPCCYFLFLFKGFCFSWGLERIFT